MSRRLDDVSNGPEGHLLDIWELEGTPSSEISADGQAVFSHVVPVFAMKESEKLTPRTRRGKGLTVLVHPVSAGTGPRER
jgi:hypothetical protein